jgi:hypothetical protein
MARGRRVDKVKAATASELREKLGHSERQIAKEVGLPALTIHTILSKANGWDQIADEPVFRAASCTTKQSIRAGGAIDGGQGDGAELNTRSTKPAFTTLP